MIKVVYNRTMVLDTLRPKDKFKNDVLTLFAGRRGSAFYSEERRNEYEMSTNIEYVLRTFEDPERFKHVAHLEREVIFRDYDRNVTTVHQRYDLSSWEMKEETVSPSWTIKDSIATILGYDCIMATADYRGRRWTAFFSPEIPISEGPWKLIGLPGLILKAHDSKNEYSYEATEINTSNPGLVEYFNYRDRLIIRDRLKGLTRRYREKESNIVEKIRAAHGFSNKPVAADSIEDSRYDFEETDYPHE